MGRLYLLTIPSVYVYHNQRFNIIMIEILTSADNFKLAHNLHHLFYGYFKVSGNSSFLGWPSKES